MKSALQLFTVSVCFCVSCGIAVAQGAPCAADGNSAQASPIGCVTGEGVQITSVSVAEKAGETQSLAPEQRPAIPPTVTYTGGKLTVFAKNSTLGDILRAIATKTGASVDIPDGSEERVVTQLGPAPARDVVAALLNGSHFNYVLVGTESDPAAIAHVVITAKSEKTDGNTTAGASTMASSGRGMVQPRTALQAAVMQPYQEMLQQQQAQQAAAEELQAQAQAAAEAAQEQAAQQASGDAGSASATAATGGGGETAGVEPPPPAEAPRVGNSQADKTPQQLLQDMYETRRQMMQQQHQPPAPPQ